MGMHELICGWNFVKLPHSNELFDAIVEYVTNMFEFEYLQFRNRCILFANFPQYLCEIFNDIGGNVYQMNGFDRHLTFVIGNWTDKIWIQKRI